MQNSKIFIKLTTLLILLLFIVCVTGFKHEFAPSKNAYATIFYEGTPKDEGNLQTLLLITFSS